MRRRHDANASSGGVDWGRGVYRNWEECAYAWARWGIGAPVGSAAEPHLIPTGIAMEPHRNSAAGWRTNVPFDQRSEPPTAGSAFFIAGGV